MRLQDERAREVAYPSTTLSEPNTKRRDAAEAAAQAILDARACAPRIGSPNESLTLFA